MYYSTQEFLDYLKEKNFRCSTLHEANSKEDADVLAIGFTEKNVKIAVKAFFDGDERRVTFRANNLVTIPAEKVPAMLVAVNAANSKYRYVKFSVDMERCAVHASTDCIFRRFEIGEICFEALARLVNVCNDVYPDLMKAIESQPS